MKKIHETLESINHLAGVLMRIDQYPNMEYVADKLNKALSYNKERGLFDALSENAITYDIEKMLIETDDNGRRFIFRRIFHEYKYVFDYAGMMDEVLDVIDNKKDELGELVDFAHWLSLAIKDFAANIYVLCVDCNFLPEELAGYEISNDVLSYRIFERDFNCDRKQKYKVFPSTYRRAAVMALIEASGLCKDIDKTKKAAFVEAVTGGNIEADPKDTVSYKIPEPNAKDAAKKLLQETLRIDVK